MNDWKFRGWDATGQKGWVCGDLTHTKKVLVEEPFLTDRIEVAHYEVVPESVGLCSDLEDRNGYFISEGDIVRWLKDGKKYVVKFRRGMFYASVNEFNEGVYGGFPLWYLCENEQPCEIVGNVFENKLKTKDNYGKIY